LKKGKLRNRRTIGSVSGVWVSRVENKREKRKKKGQSNPPRVRGQFKKRNEEVLKQTSFGAGCV